MFPPPFPSAPRRPRGTCALLCEHTPWQLRCTPTVGSRAEVQVESEQTCGWNQVGQPIDENLAMQDPITGEQLVGVGIFFQQEADDWIYVASLLPGSSAELSGRIRVDDELVRVDEMEVTPAPEERPRPKRPRTRNAGAEPAHGARGRSPRGTRSTRCGARSSALAGPSSHCTSAARAGSTAPAPAPSSTAST